MVANVPFFEKIRHFSHLFFLMHAWSLWASLVLLEEGTVYQTVVLAGILVKVATKGWASICHCQSHKPLAKGSLAIDVSMLLFAVLIFRRCNDRSNELTGNDMFPGEAEHLMCGCGFYSIQYIECEPIIADYEVPRPSLRSEMESALN